MPTVTYTNNPDLRGQSGTVYAPDLPWWVQEQQPQAYNYEPPPDNYNPSARSSAPYDLLSSGSTPLNTPSSRSSSGQLSLNDILGGLDIPVYGGGGGAKETAQQKFARLSVYGGGSSGGGGGYAQAASPIGGIQTTTSRRVFKGERPTLTLPKRDARRVASLTQAAAGPGIRKLRSALNRALVKSYENPNVARLVARSALEGYGTGLSDVLGGAARTAEAQNANEMNITTQEAMANYQAAMTEYTAGAETVQTTTNRNVYEGSDKALKQQLQGYRA